MEQYITNLTNLTKCIYNVLFQRKVRNNIQELIQIGKQHLVHELAFSQICFFHPVIIVFALSEVVG